MSGPGWFQSPAFLDIWADHEFTDVHPERIEAPPVPVRTMKEQDAIFADRRKLAIGRAILAHGPQSAGQIGQLCAAAGAPVDCADQYVRTLVNRTSGFLVTLYTPTRWDLTDKGRAWVRARIAGETV